ncbi:hypothetical protein B0H10DRAFT_1990176 [Mycena sp. CBHHK59/15]|nr:hypothetical protein B0H10DRAFT_1990176 [Mycena sp. CBHHK59/15]
MCGTGGMCYDVMRMVVVGRRGRTGGWGAMTSRGGRTGDGGGTQGPPFEDGGPVPKRRRCARERVRKGVVGWTGIEGTGCPSRTNVDMPRSHSALRTARPSVLDALRSHLSLARASYPMPSCAGASAVFRPSSLAGTLRFAVAQSPSAWWWIGGHECRRWRTCGRSARRRRRDTFHPFPAPRLPPPNQTWPSAPPTSQAQVFY